MRLLSFWIAAWVALAPFAAGGSSVVHSRHSLVAPVLRVALYASPVAESGDGAATSSFCSGVTEIPQPECQALVDLYTSAGGPGWTHRGGWLATSTPCSWYGVTCAFGHVQGLDLKANQLDGVIPSSLGNLSDLRSLLLSDNELSGGIPTALGNLSQLFVLDLSWNPLGGNVPSSLAGLSNLTGLHLAGCQLEGRIPPSLGDLANLQNLSLRRNQLTGGIPVTLGRLANLRGLYLDDNQLDGSIPAKLGNLSKLESLWLNANLLSGGLPPALGQLVALRSLRVNDNGLGGALPSSLTGLGALSVFHFHQTDLCEPPDAAFQAWLAGIDNLSSTGVKCFCRTYLPIAIKRWQPPAPTLIFADNFDDGLLTGWTPNGGIWTNPGGYMCGEDRHPPDHLIMHIKSASGADVIYEGTVTFISGYSVTLAFRGTEDLRTAYEVGLVALDNHFRLGMRTPDYWMLLAEAPLAIESGHSYHIKVVAKGSLLEAYLDGVKLLSAEDDHLASGRFGVIQTGGYYGDRAVAHFDDLKAWELP